MTQSQIILLLSRIKHKVNNFSYDTFDNNTSDRRGELQDILSELSSAIKSLEKEFDGE